ncbi:MAG: condensation domain-containing protein [Candidatus Eisenbacteria bacterium]
MGARGGDPSFDLARGPLFRARLLRLAPRRHTLLVTIHHAAADGWSFVVLVRELGELYGAALAGRAHDRESSPLAPLAVQYADWAAWQRAWLEGGEMTRQLDYWRGELQGIETLVLPGDRPRPARPSYGGASIPVRLSARLRRKLEALARTERATLHMVLLAGFGAALGRWSGQESFAVGTPVANRRTREVEPLIGFFVNTLALRLRLDGARLSFRQLLARVRESALGAEANQDVPFERVVEELAPERQLGHTPLFQVLFALQNVPVTSLPLPGLTLHYDEPETGVTRFDLELFLAESEAMETAIGGRGVEAGLDGLLNYSTELFDRVTVERFVENLAALLDVASDAPDAPLDALPPMAPSGMHLALREWNAATSEYGDPLVVHPLFERWAHEAPAAIALRLGAETLTYGALNARANQLARRLRARDVGRGTSSRSRSIGLSRW